MADPADAAVAEKPPVAAPATGTSAASDPTADLAKLQREKVGAESKLLGGVEGDMAKGLKRVEGAYQAEGASLHDPALKPWNEKEQQAKYQTDPIAAFASFGSVFGIIASAFTHAPMVNALNASASAIDAIKKGDRQGYEDARKAWESNWKEAMDRQKIQHEQYQDAISLLKTNMAAGEAKLRVLAAKFGDQKTLVMLEHGMSKEVLDMQAAREKLATDMATNHEKVTLANAELSRLFALGYDPKNPQSPESQKAFVEFQQEQAKLKAMTHPSLFGGSQNLTLERQIAAAVAKHRMDMQTQHPDWNEDKLNSESMSYARKLKQEATPITANKADDIKFSIDRIDAAEHIMDKIEALLKKHNAISGFAGHITTGAETVGEIFGSDESDRKEFQRLVNTLKLMGPRVLLDSKGRPLGAEAERIDSIIAGTNFGDLKPNTLRAYKELRDILEFKKKDMEKRLGGGGAGAGEPAKKEAPGGEWWKSPAAGPVVHP